MNDGLLRPLRGPVDLPDERARAAARALWGPPDDPHGRDWHDGWTLHAADLPHDEPDEEGAAAAHLSGWLARAERDDAVRGD